MIKATITPSISCAVVKLNEDASLSIYAGTVEMGQGSETVLAQIAGKGVGDSAGEKFKCSASTPMSCLTI